MNRLLLVEDDNALAVAIEFTLNDEGYEVLRVDTVEEGKKAVLNNPFDLIILDINLPDGNGYELCKFIRTKSSVPIIFLTALDDEINVVLGFELGGDDYITKPFGVKEFLARIKVLLRRHSSMVTQTTKVKSGDIIVDTATAIIKKSHKDITLTAQEYKLLLIFISSPKKIIKREEILKELIDGDEAFFDENTLSVYIKRMREKIEDNPKNPQYIVTQRGLGYMWNVDIIRDGI